jgi:hypothetical protein
MPKLINSSKKSDLMFSLKEMEPNERHEMQLFQNCSESVNLMEMVAMQLRFITRSDEHTE